VSLALTTNDESPAGSRPAPDVDELLAELRRRLDELPRLYVAARSTTPTSPPPLGEPGDRLGRAIRLGRLTGVVLAIVVFLVLTRLL
jgi:hypothetical protein